MNAYTFADASRDSRNTTRRLIRVYGCDDMTAVVMDLTDDEYAVVQRVAAEVTANGGGCAPTMQTATEGDGQLWWPDEEADQ